VLQISSTGVAGSRGISPSRAASCRIGNKRAPGATPVACSAGSRMSISTARPASCSARACPSVTRSDAVVRRLHQPLRAGAATAVTAIAATAMTRGRREAVAQGRAVRGGAAASVIVVDANRSTPHDTGGRILGAPPGLWVQPRGRQPV
jgi:hypothetical protein